MYSGGFIARRVDLGKSQDCLNCWKMSYKQIAHGSHMPTPFDGDMVYYGSAREESPEWDSQIFKNASFHFKLQQLLVIQ